MSDARRAQGALSEQTVAASNVAEPITPAFTHRGMPTLATRSPEWEPEVDARLARVGTWLWIVADVFFFAAWFFAFFYLRALNNNYDWLPPGTTHPTRAIGAIIVLLAIVSAGLYWAGARTVVAQRATARLFFWLALIAGILCFGVQIYEYRNLGFDPQQGGGYPSVFVGLKGVWLFQLTGAMLWLATQIAQTRPMGDATIRPKSVVIFGNFMLFLAAIALVSYLVLYFV
jgi:heme/copper-type cytochrome/quinol oxidase subunit 3